MEDIYRNRPFKVRNADEYELSQILNLFVSPLSGLVTPFDFENNIVKGKMGSGKTMYLRANHACYLYQLVPNIIDNQDLILPVFIKLSDFQHLREPAEIYRSIIIKIIEELASIYLRLQEVNEFAKIHSGFRYLPDAMFSSHKLSKTLTQLKKLGADKYVERIESELGLTGGVKPRFFELSANFQKNKMVEIKQKLNPGIKDVEEAYKSLIEDKKAKILLLIDEAGALDKSFFKGRNNDSFFEILMNQFRTAEFIRTKIAIYPNSFQDVLTETRYGDTVKLESDIMDTNGYKAFRIKVYELITNYLNPNGDENIFPEKLFDISKEAIYGDCLEQLINASNGNLRRLIQLLDSVMEVAFSNHWGKGKISLNHVESTLKKHARATEDLFSEPDRLLLNNIVQACKSRSTYKFQFPNMSMALNKYTSRSQEYNIINIIDFGTGRRGTTYAFDYCFCVEHDIPTHYITGSEKINKDRSLSTGRWAPRVAQVSEEIIQQASITNKIEGAIDYFSSTGGFIVGDNNDSYFFQLSFVIQEDQKKPIIQGRRVRFIPYKFGETNMAQAIEIL
jgi:hypothetical protein